MNGLLYDMDVRTTDPNATGHRRAQFHQGWDKALAGAELTETTLRQLTWHNLGYRLGKLFGPASDELIDQMYDWCVAQQET